MGGAMTTTIEQTTLPTSQERPRLFSLRGRIGRARYVVFSIGAIVLLFFVMLLAGLALQLAGQFGRLLYIAFAILLFYVVLPVYFTILTVKRAHDFNFSGWIALLLLVPIVNPLLFWLMPGTRNENAYGPVPQEEPLSIKLAAIILPAFLIAFYLMTGEIRIYQQENTDPASQPTTTLKPYQP